MLTVKIERYSILLNNNLTVSLAYAKVHQGFKY